MHGTNPTTRWVGSIEGVVALRRDRQQGAMDDTIMTTAVSTVAYRQNVVESLADMISQGLTPLIPARGSISASGDLSPLSYLGGMLEGNESIFVRVPDSQGASKVISVVASCGNLNHMVLVLPGRKDSTEGCGAWGCRAWGVRS